MIFSLGFFDYAIKKGMAKNKIFTIYAIVYLILCILLIVFMQFKIVGAFTVLMVYLLRMFLIKRFLNRF
jgi:hypothetical protein